MIDRFVKYNLRRPKDRDLDRKRLSFGLESLLGFLIGAGEPFRDGVEMFSWRAVNVGDCLGLV